MGEKAKNGAAVSHGSKLKKRKELILKIISEAGEKGVSLDQVIDGIEHAEGVRKGRGTISDNIKVLIKEGHPIKHKGADKRYYIADDESRISYEDITGYEMLTEKMVISWLIMFFMEREKRFVTFKDIEEFYTEKILDDSENHLSDWKPEIKENDSTLRNILKDLQNKGYITINDKADISALLTYEDRQKEDNTRFYSLSDSAPVITPISEDDSYDFSDYYNNGGYSGELREVLNKISEKFEKIFFDYGTEIYDSYITTGRINKISEGLLEKLNMFLRLPIKTRAVLVKHAGNPEGDRIKTGIIIFSTEKNMLYIIGEKTERKTEDKRDFTVIRMDKIISAEALEEKNDIYESNFYLELRKKMWGVTPEEPVDTEILFDNVPYVRKKVERLQRLRGETARVIYPPKDDEYEKIVYRDRIIGFNDFLPYIRSMGSSAVIIRPEPARQVMIERTKEIIDNYKELHEKWEKQQKDLKGSRN